MSIVLPTEASKPVTELGKQTILLYGSPKLGKSSFASKAPGSLFFECEPGLNHLEVFKVPTYSWEAFLEACKLVAKGDHNFKTIVIDTVDNAFKMCSDYVCAKHGIEYEGDMGHGKGWALVKNEWHRVLTRLAMSVNGHNGKAVQGIDISIVKLVPRSERKVAKKYRARIESSLRAVGLIEPLIVYPLKDGYEILDGVLRYRILLDMGVESVPCLIHSTRDGFTGNRMVNQLSASQEMRRRQPRGTAIRGCASTQEEVDLHVNQQAAITVISG